MIAPQPKTFIKDAIFISHTSLSDFLNCPRAYYLKNIYRDKKTGNRLQIASPHLSLGSTVHDVIRWYLDLQGQVVLDQLLIKYDNLWLKYAGKKGGFQTADEEETFKSRGRQILQNFFKNAKNLGRQVKIRDFPKYILEGNLVLSGNLDFIEELPGGSLHVVDFKTGKGDEPSTTQLHIYGILAESNLGKPVTRASFWYLDRDEKPKEVVLDSLEGKLVWLKEKGREVKKAIEEGRWVCIQGEKLCRDCRDYQAILEGEGEFQFEDFRYKKDVYYLERNA